MVNGDNEIIDRLLISGTRERGHLARCPPLGWDGALLSIVLLAKIGADRIFGSLAAQRNSIGFSLMTSLMSLMMMGIYRGISTNIMNDAINELMMVS